MDPVTPACPAVGPGANGVLHSLDANMALQRFASPALIIGLVYGTTRPPLPATRLVSRDRQPLTTLVASSTPRAGPGAVCVCAPGDRQVRLACRSVQCGGSIGRVVLRGSLIAG
jgi:hypothetical protein